MAGRPFVGAGDLDHGVGAVEGLPEAEGLGGGLLGAVGHGGGDFEADEPVVAVGAVVGGAEEVEGAGDVVLGQCIIDAVGVGTLLDEVLHLGVVVGAVGDGLVEDGGVGGDALEVVFVDEALEFAGVEEGAAHEIHPGALSEGLKGGHGAGGGSGHDGCSPVRVHRWSQGPTRRPWLCWTCTKKAAVGESRGNRLPWRRGNIGSSYNPDRRRARGRPLREVTRIS